MVVQNWGTEAAPGADGFSAAPGAGPAAGAQPGGDVTELFSPIFRKQHFSG